MAWCINHGALNYVEFRAAMHPIPNYVEFGTKS